MDVVILGLEHVKVLKPSGHHWHCPRMVCLKESIACRRRPSIWRRRQLRSSLLGVGSRKGMLVPKWVAPYLYTLLGLEPQPWSGLHHRSRHARFGSAVALPVIIFLHLHIFRFQTFYPIFVRFTSLSHVFRVLRGKPKDHGQHIFAIPNACQPELPSLRSSLTNHLCLHSYSHGFSLNWSLRVVSRATQSTQAITRPSRQFHHDIKTWPTFCPQPHR
jgi:hypothetical protein